MKPESGSPLFVLRDIEVSYGARHDGGADLVCPRLDIGAAPVVFLTGPNGSGKSTFLKLLDGLVDARKGRVEYRGDAAAAGCRSIYLHQHPYIFAGTVGYNAAFACRAARMPVAEARLRAHAALASLGLDGYSVRRHRRLSGGEAQRVALARVIASGARVLLLDEPTASADAESARLIGLVLEELARSGRSLLMSSHDPAFIDEFSPGSPRRVLAFDRGRIVADTIHGGRAPEPGLSRISGARTAPESP